MIHQLAKWFLIGPSIPAWAITNLFHLQYYYSTETWSKNKFLGYTIKQCPLDLQIYHELLYQIRPSFVLQTGVSLGGSILFFAQTLDMIGAPPDVPVIGIDIELTEQARSLQHPRIHLIEGSSVDPSVVQRARQITGNVRGFVSLDSDHSKAHVAAEIDIYKDFVDLQSYLVVEDTNLNGHPVEPRWGPGPMEAVRDFLNREPRFVADDRIWRRNRFSHHQGGWLKKVRE